METFDPRGIHTGDSIVVAPSQTLTNREYHILRMASFKVAGALGIMGECNIQFALDQKSEESRVIELTSRLSRSSALASKATGYPIAYIAAKLAIGYTLPELRNKVTGATTACFEPALDYITVKIPRWDFQKFASASRIIGTQMKSVGEVMAIGRKFEEALQKAVRMLDIGRELTQVRGLDSDLARIRKEIEFPTDLRLFYVVKGLMSGLSVEEIHSLSGIDMWFLRKLEGLVRFEEELLLSSGLDPGTLRRAKELGYSDRLLGTLMGKEETQVRKLRKSMGIIPSVKQIDTLSAEWPAVTNYLYLTYNGASDDIVPKQAKKCVVLGSGCYRIGSSVEFDWCCVNMALALKEKGIQEVIMVNYNPETVSTDFDILDKLYFDELSLERVLDIVDKESPDCVVVSVGGQIPNNLALQLATAGIRILGTAAEDIDRAEDRAKFSAELDLLQIPQPPWSRLESLEQAKRAARNLGYPVLIRPSYVLSGSSMKVADNEGELEDYLEGAGGISSEHRVVMSKFVVDAREVEVDAVSDGKNVFIGAIIEHVEEGEAESRGYAVKAPQFSFMRLEGADPVTSVDMVSTGEVACFGESFDEAFLKALMASGFKLPERSILLSTGPPKTKEYLLPTVRKLAGMGFELFATGGTAKFLEANRIKTTLLHWPLDGKEPNAATYLSHRKIDLVINIPKSFEEEELSNDYLIRRRAVEFGIPIITNPELAVALTAALGKSVPLGI